MSKKRTRHPDEPRRRPNIHPPKQPNGIWPAHETPDGRRFNGLSNKPLSNDKEAGIAKRIQNGHTRNFPGAPDFEGPSDKMLAVIQSGAVLRPHQIANIRQGIVSIVERNLTRAEQVLEGTVKWDATQGKLFLGLLNKVSPNMGESGFSRATAPEHDFNNFSRAELESALADVLNTAKVVDVVPEPEKPKRKPSVHDRKVMRRAGKLRKNTVLEVRARYAEKPKTELPPLTRAEDDINRRRMAGQVRETQRKHARNKVLVDLEAMAQADPIESEDEVHPELIDDDPPEGE